jgi:hypothetical protein
MGGDISPWRLLTYQTLLTHSFIKLKLTLIAESFEGKENKNLKFNKTDKKKDKKY